MNTRSLGSSSRASALPRVPATVRAVLSLLERLQHGTLDVQTPDGASLRFGSGEGPRAALRIDDWAVCARVLKSGDIGLAESFIDGQWHSPDVAALLGVFLANREAIDRAVYGSRWGGWWYRLRHRLHRNSRRGSRKNIHAHYDLGNEFYRLWLDPTMNYSSAWFEGDRSAPLPAAQRAKIRRALDSADVRSGDRVLEIGCGWGALAEQAVRERGAQVTGVTLSTEQLDWARDRLRRAGVTDRADLRLQDYRDIAAAPGFEPFDALVSIEMFEAVGREYWDGYFDTVRRCLKPGGRACIQSITIRDDLFERYVRSTDFIQQYVFPGGLLPSVQAFTAAASRAGLVVEEAFAFGPDYAETLRRWRDRFMAELPRVRALNFDTRFVRIWEFYLAYCEAAFEHGSTNVVQFTLRRP